LKSEGITRQLDYWTRELAGAPGFLELPSDRPRPAVQTFRGAWHPITLPQAATIALKNLGQREGVTLFTALLAVLQALLKRYTGQEHILVGTPVANRPRTELEGLIGCFLNTVVLRGNLSGDPTFRDVLRQGRETVLEALAHQDVPLEKLIDVLRPERNQSYSPLFQVLLVLQNTPMPEVEMGGLTLRPFEVANGTAKFDLMLSLTETTEGLEGWIEYATDLFDADRIRRLAGHFQRMIEEFSANPDLRLSQVSLLTPDERQQLLVDWNRTAVDYPRNSCIHELFEAQAEHTPQATALVCGAERHTYRELNRQANQLAHRLRELGVGPETLVGVCVRRSPEMVVGLLAILKAGGAYVPLDPAYPKERLAFILEDARAPVLLTQRSLCEGFQARNPELRLICLDAHDNLGGQSSMRNTQSRVTSNRLAYVIYTSGSTGKPKGVAIEHRSAVAFIHWANSVFTREELAGVLASTSICFDLSVFELFVPLSRGGTVILADNALQLPGLAVQPEVTLINTVPSAMAELLRIGGVPESVRTVNLAGEPLSGRLVQQIYQLPGIQKVYDLYGPSEDTTYSTFVLRSPNGPVTIGQPISNTQAYVLDNHLQPVPVGVPGELFLSGDGLARGYLNRPELTAEKFVANPFGDGFGARLYKTGDLARYRPDGNIEFLGRRDHQVKIRGFRIELGEVESALNELIAVSESVVVSREDEAGDKRLVAYVVPKQAHTLNVVELRDFLIKKLPDYMLPSAFVFLDKLPLTPNGKVDRKALPKPSRTSPEIGSGPLAPSDVLEQQLVQIWEKVLRVRPVGLRDNFFDLGGHSLIAVRLFSELRKQTGRNFPLATLFQAPTVEQLAEFLRKDGWSPHWSSLVPIQPGGGKPPFFSVHGGGGNVLLFRDLAHRLGSDYPFYGLQSQGLDGKGNYLRSVTEMASHYLDEIREFRNCLS
jgi:amino acid adenylation domain-containing protein